MDVKIIIYILKKNKISIKYINIIIKKKKKKKKKKKTFFSLMYLLYSS